MLNLVRNNPSLAYNYLPLKEVPQFSTPGIHELWETCLKMGASGSGFGSSEPYPFGSVKVPGLVYTNWYDPFSRNSFRSFTGMTINGGDEFTRRHQHLLAGPWCHCKPQRVLGDIDFGPFADEAGSGASGYILSFFDRYLKGKDIDLPVVRYFTMGKNSWNDSSAWPLPVPNSSGFSCTVAVKPIPVPVTACLPVTNRLTNPRIALPIIR
jgi:predicted acyl esterase